MKRTLKIAGFGLVALLVSACNTIAGAGKDVQAGGNAIENAADETQEEMSD